MSAIDWNAYRDRFPAVRRWTYLNTAGGGAVSDAVAAAGRQYFDDFHQDGDTHWPDWRARTEAIRALTAATLNATPREIAFVPTASHGLNLLAQMLGGPGAGVLTVAREFPSVTLPWINQGSPVTFVEPADDGAIDLDGAARAVTPETRHLVISHVQYRTGYRHDLAALRALCDDNRLTLIVDATQSAGAYPLDVARPRVDALVTSAYKWLGAGYGVAVLYLRDGLRATLAPPAVGWRSARVPYDMLYDRLDLTDDAEVHELGHPPIPGILALGASLGLLREIGIERIAARIGALTATLHERAGAAGLKIVSTADPAARSGITMIALDDAETVHAELLRRRVFVSRYGDRLRVSLHFYNDESDIGRLIDALVDITAP
jgi:selenocysteine lyase/cysteine desulfurase